MADTPKHSVSVAGIVVDDQDRVLVIQRRDNGHWEPPGGVLELNETPEEGVRREVKEETGLSVAVGNLSGVYKNLPGGIVALVFRCSVQSGDIRTSPESSKVDWKTVQQVRAIMAPAFAIRIEDAFEAGTAVRTHDGKQLLSH